MLQTSHLQGMWGFGSDGVAALLSACVLACPLLFIIPCLDGLFQGTVYIYIEDVFWSATILHTADMTQPSQSASSKQSACVHAGKTSTTQDIRAGYLVLPGYALDTADASQVECVKPSLLPAICCPCLALMYVLATHAL